LRWWGEDVEAMFGGYVKKSVGEERKRGRREEGESKIITFPEI